MAEPRITQAMPYDTPRVLTPTFVGGERTIPLKICAQSDPLPLQYNDFDQYPLVAPQS